MFTYLRILSQKKLFYFFKLIKTIQKILEQIVAIWIDCMNCWQKINLCRYCQSYVKFCGISTIQKLCPKSCNRCGNPEPTCKDKNPR